MHYILDGNNIIKHPLWQTGRGIDDRQSLIIHLTSYRKNHPSVFFTVVFDGWSDVSYSYPGIKILWSYNDEADRVIIDKLRSLSKTTIVVSNDNEIRKHARLNGFKVIKVEGFLDITDKSGKTSAKNSPEEASNKISYSRVPAIEKELKKYYEKNPPNIRIRKTRKMF